MSPSGETASTVSVQTLPSGLSEDELLQLVWTLCPPGCTGVADPMRKSTWMRPVVGEHELDGGKLLPDGTRLFHTLRAAQRM